MVRPCCLLFNLTSYPNHSFPCTCTCTLNVHEFNHREAGAEKLSMLLKRTLGIAHIVAQTFFKAFKAETGRHIPFWLLLAFGKELIGLKIAAAEALYIRLSCGALFLGFFSGQLLSRLAAANGNSKDKDAGQQGRKSRVV